MAIREYSATVEIESLAILNGALPKRVYRMILEWAIEHRPSLRSNWIQARKHRALESIEPLE